jgi:hypothetical protein
MSANDFANNLAKKDYFRSAKNILIYPTLQIYFAAIYLLFFFFGCLIMFATIYLTFSASAETWSPQENLLFQRFVGSLFAANWHILFLVILLFAVTIIPLGILLTHKIGGPLFVIKRQIAALAEGDYKDRIHLRKEDYLSEISVELNKLADRLETGGK